jgi:hypothetical protein
MNPPSEDIKDILDDASSLGLTFATDLFVSEMPISPDACVAIYDTGGEPAEPDYVYERPTVQVKVRGARGRYRDAHILAQTIRDLLNGMHNEELNGARYIAIWIETDVIFIGYDESHRPQFTLNLRIHRTGTT